MNPIAQGKDWAGAERWWTLRGRSTGLRVGETSVDETSTRGPASTLCKWETGWCNPNGTRVKVGETSTIIAPCPFGAVFWKYRAARKGDVVLLQVQGQHRHMAGGGAPEQPARRRRHGRARGGRRGGGVVTVTLSVREGEELGVVANGHDRMFDERSCSGWTECCWFRTGSAAICGCTRC